jgi:hypothetical protein
MRRTLTVMAGAAGLVALIWFAGHLWPSRAAHGMKPGGQTELPPEVHVVDTGPIRVAMPVGLPDEAAVADRARTLYEAAAALVQAPPQREATVVLTGPEPEAAARAVMSLWLPEPKGEIAWWSQGATDFYAMRLLDQTGLWARPDQVKWLKGHQSDRGFALVQWLDAALRYTNRKDTAGEMLRAAMSARSTADVIAAVKSVGGLTTADTLDRMLRGREPLPVVQGTPG